MEGRSRFGFAPIVILRLAGTYPSLLKVVLEMIQNSLDKKARHIWVNVNQKTRMAAVQDDGEGVSSEFFELALLSIGNTLKKVTDLGRFGLGLISPTDKCESYTFTSCPKGGDLYVEWTFNQQEIAEKKVDSIPYRPRPDLVFGNYSGHRHGVGKVTGVPWRTQARMEKITKNRLMTAMTMETLCESIMDNYNQKMKKNHAVVIVTYTDHDGNRYQEELHPRDFSGSPLKQERITTRDGGDTMFRLFLARSSQRGSGKVLVGEDNNDFRIPFATFQKSLPDGLKLSDETTAAMLSGVFEGEILSSRATWHPDRKSFVANDALLGFCAAIDDWFQKIGRQFYQEADHVRKVERLQVLAERSLLKLRALCDTEFGSSIKKLIETFRFGTIGKGHSRYSGGAGMPGTRVSGPRAGGEVKGGTSGAIDPTAHKKGDHPFIVGGEGKERQEVKGHSQGLHFFIEPLAQSGKLWDIDLEKGILTINSRHPLWVRCDDIGDKALERYQDFLLVEALTICSVAVEHPEWLDIASLVTETKAGAMAWFFTDAEKILRQETSSSSPSMIKSKVIKMRRK